MEPSPTTTYRVASRSALSAYALALVLLLIGVVALAGVATIWFSDLWTDLIGRDELTESGEWVREQPVTSVRIVWSLGLGLVGALLIAGGTAALVQTRRSTTGRYGLLVGSDGLRVESNTTRFTIAWSRVAEVAVVDEGGHRVLALTCTGTDLADLLGAEQVDRRERQLRDLLHPRVTRLAAEEIVRLGPLSALGDRERDFLADVRLRVGATG